MMPDEPLDVERMTLREREAYELARLTLEERDRCERMRSHVRRTLADFRRLRRWGWQMPDGTRLAVEQDRRRRRTQSAARWDASLCAECGTSLAPGSAVWLRTVHPADTRSFYLDRSKTKPCCAACGPGRAERGEVGFEAEGWFAPTPCEGCGRPVYVRGFARCETNAIGLGHPGTTPDEVPRDPLWCSRRCHRLTRARTRAAEVRAARRVRCGCGLEFVPTRADARHCSNACRQRAHRQKGGQQEAAS